MKTNLLFRLTMVLCISALFTGKMVAQSDNVGLNGSAALNGFCQYGPVQMLQDKTNLTKYTFSGYLTTGELKFSTNADWNPSWGPTTNGTAMPSTGYSGALVPNTVGDNKLAVQQAGNYSIIIDLTALTVNIQPMTETIPIKVNRLFIIGDATANGWSLATAPELAPTNGNPWEFTYTGTLSSTGGFKFTTSKGDFSQNLYMKTSDTQMFLGKTPDSKWSVSTNGNYKVTLNTNTLAISILKQTTTVNETLSKEYPSLESNVVRNELKVINNSNFNYAIYNLTGSNLLKGLSFNGKINVSSLNNGIYLLNVDNKAFKFIKQ